MGKTLPNPCKLTSVKPILIYITITEKLVDNQAFIRGVPEVMIDFFPLSLFNLYYYLTQQHES